jgi:hypothetical protein
MNKPTRFKSGSVAVLVLLALLTFLVLQRKGLTAKEAEDEAVGEVVLAENAVIGDPITAGVVLVMVVLFGFVTWTAIRANDREDKAMPPTRESSASDNMTLR